MNYLAHAYLSFNQPKILVGNMISDYVKGKRKFDFEEGVQQGIMLHRAIDEFTDMHPVTKEAKQYFKADYGLYAGAFMDVVYDHFLALDKHQFPADNALMECSSNAYSILENYMAILPEKFRAMLPYMQQQNWLYNYQFNWGIQKSFEGLVHRAVYMNSSIKAFEIFETNYQALQQAYRAFFPELKFFVENWNK